MGGKHIFPKTKCRKERGKPQHTHLCVRRPQGVQISTHGETHKCMIYYFICTEQKRRRKCTKKVRERERESEGWWHREKRTRNERETAERGRGAGRRGLWPSVKDIKNPAASGDTQLSSILLLKCLQNLIHLACHLISPWKPRFLSLLTPTVSDLQHLGMRLGIFYRWQKVWCMYTG